MKTIPKVVSKDPGERRLLEALKEAVEVGEGVRGDPLDRKLTLRDLLSSGMATLKLSLRSNRYVAGSDIIPQYPVSSGSSSGSGEIDLTPPDAPENLVVTQSYSGAFLTWDSPSYGNHAHTNIYRSADDNYSNASVITNAPGSIYADPIPYEVIDPGTGEIKGYYYWITFVSEAGIEGPPNAVSGEYGEPSTDPEYFIDVLSKDGENDAPFFEVDTPTEINGVTVPPGVYIKELFVADGTFGSAKIRDLAVDKLIGDKGAFVTANIVDASITSAKIAQSIQSNNYDADNGWYINKNGTAILNNAVIRGAAQSQGYDSASQGWQLLADGSFTLRGAGGTVLMSTAGVPMNAITGAGDLAYLNSIPNGTYIANAIVDTLHLAGQAVTIPRGSQTSGSYTIPNSTTWGTAKSFTFTAVGAPIEVTFSMEISISFSWRVDVRVRRDSTILADYEDIGSAAVNAYSAASVPFSAIFKDDPGAGSVTYSIQVRATWVDPENGQSGIRVVKHRTINATELQR